MAFRYAVAHGQPSGLLARSCQLQLLSRPNGRSTDSRVGLLQKVGKHAYSEPLILGLVAHLRRMFPRVGFFKPIVGMDYQPLGTQHYPRLPVVMHHTFKMKSDPGKMFAMSEDAAFRVRTLRFPIKCLSASLMLSTHPVSLLTLHASTVTTGVLCGLVLLLVEL